MGSVLPLLAALALAPPAAEPEPRVLVLLVDSVPDDTAHFALRDPEVAARFPGFRGPVTLISAFPSDTGVAVAGILKPFGVEKPPGYELRFFDRSKNRILGGGPVSYHTFRYDYRDRFDFRIAQLPRKALSYGFHERYNAWEIDEALKGFEASDKPVYLAHITSTDASAHMSSPPELKHILAHLGEALEALRARATRPFYTVIFSDHGVGQGPESPTNIKADLFRALERRGWTRSRSLRSERDVVIVGGGLLSVLVAYTQPDQALRLARHISLVEGVDLCALDDGAGWRVVARRSAARIERRREGERTLFRYRPLRGDPLGYLPVLERLRAAAGAPDQAWFPDDDWRRATAGEVFPDALYRVPAAFESVQNPASVVCSLDETHMFGLLSLQALQRVWFGPWLRTHGSLRREPSGAFLFTDHPGFVPRGAVRFDQALDFLTPER